MRRKVEENTHAMIEVRSETDAKLSAKEGQKLWANFRKYAMYDELKDLYRKTMPAISQFEDKLQANNDHNERIDMMMRRMDEVICQKSDRQVIKDFREHVDKTFITKEDNVATIEITTEKLGEFGKRCDEMEEMVKF